MLNLECCLVNDMAIFFVTCRYYTWLLTIVIESNAASRVPCLNDKSARHDIQ